MDIAEALNLLLYTFTAIFSVVNPLGVIPVFLALKGNAPISEQRTQARKASIYMFFILAAFLLIGSYLMDFFGISLTGIRLAGGVVIFRSGFLLLTTARKQAIDQQRQDDVAENVEDISLTPLALPLLSGPGAIAATLSLIADDRYDWLFMIITIVAIFISALLSYLALTLSTRVVPFIGPAGVEVATRIMGFIAMVIGVEFVLNGIRQYVATFL